MLGARRTLLSRLPRKSAEPEAPVASRPQEASRLDPAYEHHAARQMTVFELRHRLARKRKSVRYLMGPARAALLTYG